MGGLGVLDLRVFNSAMLLKWFWWWYKPEGKIWKPIIISTVGTRNFLPDTRNFQQLKGDMQVFFNASTKFIPADGAKISLWEHNWGTGFLRHRLQNLYTFAWDTTITLQQAINTTSISELFKPNMSVQAREELEYLQQSIIANTGQRNSHDDLTWNWSASGEFSVQSAYRMIKTTPYITKTVTHIWKIQAPPRMKIFDWLAIQNRILTHENLRKRGCIVSRCQLCKAARETVRHLLQGCPFTAEVYRIVQLLWPSQNWPNQPVLDITEMTFIRTTTKEQRAQILIMQFATWRERCARNFTEVSKEPKEVGEEVRWQWQILQQRE